MKEFLSVRKYFAGKHILLTGSTGFLAKAITEKLLWELPEVGQIYLLIRPKLKPDGTEIPPSQRLKEEVLKNTAFTRLRDKYGDDFEEFCNSKIIPVCGDLTKERLGFDDETYRELVSKVNVVINSAATVVFDERLDIALELNALGPLRLLEFARNSNSTFIQISTAYVSGKRTGIIPEKLVPPLEAIDAQLPPQMPRPTRFDVKEEIAYLQEVVKQTKEETVRKIKKAGLDLNSEEARSMLETNLVEIGMKRAHQFGWNDTYTFTKYLGEQLVYLNRGNTRLAIIRPSIIESSLREPEPGWLDGLRMADPIIIGFGKGRLPDFPANLNIVLDIIPADFVVNCILASAPYIEQHPEGFDLITVASSSKNPLWFEALYDNVRDYFIKHPFIGKDGKPIEVIDWQFPSIEEFRKMLENWYIKPAKIASKILNGSIPIPGARKFRPRVKNLINRMEQLMYYVDIYGPYVNLDCRFETEKMFHLLEMLDPSERQSFDFDPRKFHWRQYLQDIHIPGLKRNILRMERLPRAGAGHGKLLEETEEARAEKQKVVLSVRGVPQTLLEIAYQSSERFGNKSFLNITRQRNGGNTTNINISYSEFFNKAGSLALKLIGGLRLHTGDRIGIIGENCPEWCVCYMAIIRAGCTAVPLDKSMPASEIVRIIRLVDAKAIILTPTVWNTVAETLSATNGIPPCLNMLEELKPFEGHKYPYLEIATGAHLKEPSPHALASILFTSGTTLEPKGVMLTHTNFVTNALAVSEVIEPMETDRFISVLPLHHAFEFTCGFIIPMYGGASIYYLETLRAQELLNTMKLAEVTVMLGVPRLLKMFMDGIQQQIKAQGWRGKLMVGVGDFVASIGEAFEYKDIRKRIFKKVHDAFGGNVRVFVSGGAALDPEIFHFFKKFGLTICEGYGLTETSPVLTVNPLTSPKPGTVGLPVPGVEINIENVDDDDIGEIVVRSPCVMQGYWKNPEATAKVLENGWFKTGDLGKFDEDGYLRILGRLKDVIVTSAGKKVHPDEIEYALRNIPGVKELCVIGLPDKSELGEEVVAVVVPEENASKPDIISAIAEATRHLPSYQHVARVEFFPKDLPKTTTLKVQRNKVREYFISGGAPTKPIAEVKPVIEAATLQSLSSADDIKVEVMRAVAKIANVEATELQPHYKLQMDLGIDSIGRVDLLQDLEVRLGINLPADLENKLFTVKDVIVVVEEAVKASAERKQRRFGRSLWQRANIKTDRIMEGLRQSKLRIALRHSFEFITGIILSTHLRVKCDGLENIPKNKPYILAANHCSHLDLPSIRKSLGALADNLHAMAAKDYFFDNPIKSWFFTTFLNALPLDREANAAESLAVCKTVLEAGRSILIFPEGTRSLTGELQQFKPGIGVLAIELDFPLIPVYLRGTYAALPKGRIIPRSGRIEVRFGKPIDFSDLKAKIGKTPTIELYRAAVARLQEKVIELSELPPVGR